MTQLPIDPDAAPNRGPADRSPRAVPRGLLLAAVFGGGCVGGLARYLVSSHWDAPARNFPWAILTINTGGAFLLAVIVVIASDLVPSRYLRPLLGTGFCGAFTTFSSVVVGADELIARHRVGVAVMYVVATVVAGLAAAALGYGAARSFALARRRAV